MAQMLLVNPALPPSKRRKPAKSTRKARANPMKKRRTAAQKAATRRMVAANKARRKTPRRRKNPVIGKRAPSRSVVRVVSRAAPSRSAPAFGVRRNIGATSRRRRRNPIAAKGMQARVMELLKSASVAAVGALTLDVAWAYLPIPASWKIGGVKHLAKGVGAIAMGYVAEQVTDKATARRLSEGALVVILHDAARDLLTQVAPGVKMDGMGYYTAAPVSMGMYSQGALPSPVRGGGVMGEYVPDGGMYDSADTLAAREMAGYGDMYG